MAMPSELRFDPKWLLSTTLLPHRFNAVPQFRIRHDIGFGWQLYLQSLDKKSQPNKAIGILAQAIASDDAKSLKMHTIFNKSIPISQNSDFMDFCIDEVAHKLYLSFEGLKADPLGNRLYHLAVFDLGFGEPDVFGHRRVTVDQESIKMYRMNFGQQSFHIRSLLLWPNSERLFFHGDEGTVTVSGEAYLLGTLDLDGARNRTVEGRVLLKDYRFISKDKQLALFNTNGLCVVQTNAQKDKRSLLQYYCIDAEPELQIQLQGNFPFDQFALIEWLYPVDLLTKMKLFMASQELGAHSYFCGRVFKYTLFNCVGGVGVVKHFDRQINEHWFETKTHFLKSPKPFLANRKHEYKAALVSVLDTCLYYSYVDVESNRKCFQRVELGDYLRDYRTCVYCRQTETGKRRNREGKRIAKFKVKL